ncbi:MAG: glycosyl hydrolase 115 family protein [Bacteroidales bacterium]|nr:glycosyl hydrolase 115 family protein [Bacteroidales bacterium]
MNKILILFSLLLLSYNSFAIDLSKATIVYDENDFALVKKMANTLANDIEMVSGTKPSIKNNLSDNFNIILACVNNSKYANCHNELIDKWECFAIDSNNKNVTIIGSDPRGLAYGVFYVSEKIGVNPWYWWADIPINQKNNVEFSENYISKSPTIKYRGLFINDEDWGLKTWSANNFEKDLNDIGPKTYDKVCELILRLKGNMLAPAMHDCTGAFYSYPKSQQVADEWGIMITTSHCEPLLFNNASSLEWNKKNDGDWNYLTNKQTIINKLDNRIKETAQYSNIYTIGMRGLHDEAMKGSDNPEVRARILEQVFEDQRSILEKYKNVSADNIPQIFVPYKETLDIYDAGLKVPDDVIIIWPDDNYGYMKRVSNSEEQKRKGGSGVYYHLSYLGTPHDYLWIATTAPMLMYEELLKSYQSGANKYWLVNAGDIKPMEIELQQFFDFAWNFDDFSYSNVNEYQAEWLAKIFGDNFKNDFQDILDTYYRLAWDRKPEYMGFEIEWDDDENSKLHDSNFDFITINKRLNDYKRISDKCELIQNQLPKNLQAPFFEMLAFSVKGAYQMNRKFLMAQLNHKDFKHQEDVKQAFDSINSLMNCYNSILNGKWNQMMSAVPPGYVAKYQEMPVLVDNNSKDFSLPQSQLRPTYKSKVDISKIKISDNFRLISGLGTDWCSLQLGNPHDVSENPLSLKSSHIDIPINISSKNDSVTIIVNVLPMWPVTNDVSNCFGVSLDGCQPIKCENKFLEWSYEWKLQVLENRKEFLITFPFNKKIKNHTLTLIIGNPGQIVQEIKIK